MPVEIPEHALAESFLAATGPGGQNVNKVATACQLRARIGALGLPEEVAARLRRLAGSRLNNEDEIVLTARRFRTREANREDARARLAELVARAQEAPAKRRPTRPGKAARAKRVEKKRRRSDVKQRRGRVSLD
ncbi:MAG: alternative ribosome rescue aminoacyl-tRNA hydrolase ArfB [Sphingosinicella sp.]